MKGRSVAAIAACAMAMGWTTAPASGQSILDSFRQLRESARRLAGGARPAGTSAAAQSPQPSATPPSSNADKLAMVPAAVLVADASDTSVGATPLVQRKVATFDVRGFKLGMSPREVARVAAREGFRHHWNEGLTTSGTFEVEAARQANVGLDHSIDRSGAEQLRSVTGSDAAGEELKLGFTLTPEGPRLSHLEYRGKLDGSTPAEALSVLVAKYGPPNGKVDGGTYHSWSNGTPPAYASSASLAAIIDGGGIDMTFDQAGDWKDAARDRLQERARQLAAAHGGGVKF